VEDGEVTNGAVVDDAYLEEMNTFINNLIRKNDMTLKYNYYKRLPKKTEEETTTGEDVEENTDGEAEE
jgi:hypothetical protein